MNAKKGRARQAKSNRVQTLPCEKLEPEPESDPSSKGHELGCVYLQIESEWQRERERERERETRTAGHLQCERPISLCIASRVGERERGKCSKHLRSMFAVNF